MFTVLSSIPTITRATDISLITWGILILLIFAAGVIFLIRGAGFGKYEPSRIETVTGAVLTFMAGLAAGFAYYPAILG